MINCDLGEGCLSAELENQLMAHIQWANISCGAHAGTPLQISQTIRQAKQHKLTVGAHPSYPDKQNFGRVAIDMPTHQLATSVVTQLQFLAQLCKQHDVSIRYIKPHGALYHQLNRHASLFEAVALAAINAGFALPWVLSATSCHPSVHAMAQKLGIVVYLEAFADRGYHKDGTLLARTEHGSQLVTAQPLITRANYLKKGQINCVTGDILQAQIDTICIHGDSEAALNTASILSRVMHG